MIELEHLTDSLTDVLSRSQTSSPVEPTFLEVAGYPALENVASNLLAFFLDPDQPHALGTLFLEALLTTLDLPTVPDELVDVQVAREDVTNQRQRIDIVVVTSGWVVGIENRHPRSTVLGWHHYGFSIGERNKHFSALRELLTRKHIEFEELAPGSGVRLPTTFPLDADLQEVQHHLQGLLQRLVNQPPTHE